MSSHVAGRKMRLSKLLFIALVALCLIFVSHSAEAGEEVAVEGEGEAVAPGAQAVEAGAEVGESQAAQDVAKSQLATTRGPTRSQAPSKAGKGSKLKIAIVIGLVILLLAVVGGLVGVFVIKPKMKVGKEKKLMEKMKGGLPDGFKFEEKKLGDDKKEFRYLIKSEKLDDAGQKAQAALYKTFTDSDAAIKDGDNYKIKLESDDDCNKICKALGKPAPEKTEKLFEYTCGVLTNLVGNDYVGRFDGRSMVIMKKSGDAKGKDGKDEKSKSKK